MTGIPDDDWWRRRRVHYPSYSGPPFGFRRNEDTEPTP